MKSSLVPLVKYVALHEFTLYGDPAFNSYQSVNDG